MNDELIKLLIVDDEPIARDIMETYVSRIPDLALVGSCKNALEAFQAVSRTRVDLLLLDINMPEITGIGFLKALKDPPYVIFTTAYSEFALESYEYSAVDYLLKPISFDRFLKGINRAIDLVRSGDERSKLPAKDMISADADKLMFIKAEGRLLKIDLKQVWFVEGLKDYVRLWTDQGKIVVHSTMKNMEDTLSKYSNFVRVHKSYIVNLEFVQEIDGNTIRLKEQSIGIGATYKDGLNLVLSKYKLL